jgi:hypothetical protein
MPPGRNQPERDGSRMSPRVEASKPEKVERCGSCNGVINQMTGECRCS